MRVCWKSHHEIRPGIWSGVVMALILPAIATRPLKVHHLTGSGRYAVAVTDGQEIPIRVLMYRAFRAAEDQILSQLHDGGFVGLTRAQHQLLLGLDTASTTATAELADHAGLALPTARALLARLAEAECVRVDEHHDAVELTDRGRHALEATQAAEQQVLQTWTATLGAEGLQQLRDGLTRINDLVPDRS